MWLIIFGLVLFYSSRFQKFLDRKDVDLILAGERKTHAARDIADMNMDFDSIRNQVSNLTLYDLKAGVRKVQNAVMNYTEIESKVREATNNDPWGASATLMQEIAAGTHSYQHLNEIMPLIYKRFTDKTAEEWRQIYKSLQLLEYLVKNGSERVIDDARSHLSLLRMLRQFHFIDANGKDQGVNVRNRAQELAKLLSDVDAIRTERKKARSNRTKFGGVEGGAGGSSLGGGTSSSGRYGGFGSETGGFGGGYGGEVYGDGGGFGGRETDFSDTQRRGDAFEEYDEDEGGPAPAPSRATRTTTTATRSTTSGVKRETQKQKQKEPQEDLFDFGDEPPASIPASKPAATSSNVLDDFGPSQSGADGDDDFDDFQSATSPAVAQPASSMLGSLSSPPAMTALPTSATQFAAPKPVAPVQTANYQGLFATVSPTRSANITPVPMTSTFSSPPPQPQVQAQPPRAAAYQPSGPNYYTSVPVLAPQPATTSSAFSNKPMTSTPSYGAPSTAASLGKPAPKPAVASAGAGGAGGDVFGSLWSTAAAKTGVNRTPTPSQGPDLASLAKAKSSAGIWGAASSGSGSGNVGSGMGMGMGAGVGQQQRSGPSGANAPLGNGLDDLLG